MSGNEDTRPSGGNRNYGLPVRAAVHNFAHLASDDKQTSYCVMQTTPTTVTTVWSGKRVCGSLSPPFCFLISACSLSVDWATDREELKRIVEASEITKCASHWTLSGPRRSRGQLRYANGWIVPKFSGPGLILFGYFGPNRHGMPREGPIRERMPRGTSVHGSNTKNGYHPHSLRTIHG